MYFVIGVIVGIVLWIINGMAFNVDIFREFNFFLLPCLLFLIVGYRICSWIDVLILVIGTSVGQFLYVILTIPASDGWIGFLLFLIAVCSLLILIAGFIGVAIGKLRNIYVMKKKA